MLCCEIISV